MAAPARVVNKSPQKQEPPANLPAKHENEEAPSSRLAWFIGWVGVPGLVFGGIFVGGALVGAHFPDGWVVWAVRGVAGLLGG